MATEYDPRVVDAELDALADLPAIALEGAKGVGKTRTAERRARTVFALDNPLELELAAADPSRLIRGTPPILIDEWQRMPSSWDLVRRAVDGAPTTSRFLLTGSATPRAPTHSGAGRIVRLRIRPLSLVERGAGREPTVSLASLLTGENPAVEGSTTFTLADYVQEICQSGLPALRNLSDRAVRAELDGYIENIVEREFPELQYVVRRPATLLRWLRAYAAATSTVASFEALRDAATPGEREKPSKATTQAYRDVLERLWILDPIPGWLPTRNHLRRLSTAPKHNLADPALAARLLGADVGALIGTDNRAPLAGHDSALVGQLFESLVTLGVRVLAQSVEARVGHFRTHEGKHEVDLIVERADHRVVALEVKLKATVDDSDVRHLRWLKAEIGSNLLDMVVLTTGLHAYRRQDGVAVVPAILLGP